MPSNFRSGMRKVSGGLKEAFSLSKKSKESETEGAAEERIGGYEGTDEPEVSESDRERTQAAQSTTRTFEEPSPSTAPQAGSSSGDAGFAATGLYPLPAPGSTPTSTPRGTPHAGPADTSSVVSPAQALATLSRLGSPPAEHRAFRLRPEAPEFEGARAILLRGQLAHVPRTSPERQDIEDRNRALSRRLAIQHAAMAYQRLTTANFDIDAQTLSGAFTQIWGEDYTNEETYATHTYNAASVVQDMWVWRDEVDEELRPTGARVNSGWGWQEQM